MIYYGWPKICIPLRQMEVSLKIQFFAFWELIKTKLNDIPYLGNHWSYKVGLIFKMITRMIYYGCSETTESALKISFREKRGLIMTRLHDFLYLMN